MSDTRNKIDQSEQYSEKASHQTFPLSRLVH
jgi:hypothetical protein